MHHKKALSRHARAAFALALIGLLALAFAPAAMADVDPHPAMLRHPDVSKTHIVFQYANDLWLVPREGGIATPLANPAGAERRPHFSPDGSKIAFVGNYDGNADIYVVPVAGGVPFRVTYHPGGERLSGWTSDGRLIYSSHRAQSPAIGDGHVYLASAEGGLPERLPLPYGEKAALSADGKTIAYTPYNRDDRTWKRYRGGMASDVWLVDLDAKTSRRMTDWEGTDSKPMWHGDKVYYLSDGGPAHRRNVWVFDTTSGQRRQVTSFTDYDIRYLNIGPGPAGQGEIVLQNGASLYLLDLATEKLSTVDVRIPGARPTLREQMVNAAGTIRSYSISPKGKRALVGARGDVWSAPAEHGSPRNMTRTSGVAERNPNWSPDGKQIAYFSDASGEYELYVRSADGKGKARRLTTDSRGYRYGMTWSPDSKKIAITDKTGQLDIVTVESAEVKKIAVDGAAGQPNPSWSPDSRFLAYALRPGGSRNPSVWIHALETGKSHQVTGDYFTVHSPTFDRKGKYLFFATSRHFSPLYGELGADFLYANTEVLAVVPLKADQPSPFAPKSDEEEFAKDEAKADKKDADKADTKKDKKSKKDKKDAKDEAKPEKKKDELVVEIDFEGFERRAVRIPVDNGNFGTLGVNDKGQLLYSRLGIRGAGGPPSIMLFDLGDDEKKEKTVASGAGGFDLSADGKMMLLVKRGAAFIQAAAPGAEKKAKKLVTTGMNTLIDPRAEWKQVITDAWRMERDFFYVENMHGVDWPKQLELSLAMLEDAVTKSDVDFIIREMLSELNIGHAYYRPTPMPQPRMPVGLLGVDWALENGAYRIKKIVEAGAWDLDGRGPLSQPGVDVKEGDYLLAVDGAPVDITKEPYAAFVGRAGRPTTITVSDKPTLDDSARDVLVEPLRSEMPLRYRAWNEQLRAYVEEKSGGRIGYIYVPNTGLDGQNELVRGFYGQVTKDALIVDDRWNGGGQIPTRFIELLNRPVTNYWARRHAQDTVWPGDAHHGPKAMLINGLAGSGGDAFPWYFRQAGLGKLIGTRTWGGLVGYSGVPGLIDGAGVTVPSIGFYEKDGTWAVEGHGVDPDMEVIDDPALMLEGGDPQLDAAIKHLMLELETKAYKPARRPADPDRSGMGVLVKDH